MISRFNPRLVVITTIAAISMLTAAPNSLASSQLGHIGAWTAKMGGGSPSKKFCVMKETFRDGGVFGFRFDHSGAHMYAYKPQWNLAGKGRHLQMILHVDGVDYSHPARIATQSLIKTDVIDWKGFRVLVHSQRAQLRIMFARPVTWTLNLTGARQVAEIVDRCVHQQGI